MDKTKKYFLIQTLPVFFFCLLLLIIFKFFLLLGVVPSLSMYPTLDKGTAVLASRKITTINRDDILIFQSNEKDELYVKRIIGLPGDVIKIENGNVYVNGKLKEEPFIKEAMEKAEAKTYTVPNDSYFFLGDNRNDSYDSRYWKNPYIKKSEIKGKVFYWF